ncbi:hypothetical protein J6590_070302 [Homalodisca vitripennis]|nr:hypothetical protein J6590_070302 [Homalodisca vitripennis]
MLNIRSKQNYRLDLPLKKLNYLAEHLNFLDNFLKSRQSKGNITEVETAQEEEEQNSEDEQLDDGAVEERDATQDSAQDANLPTTGDTSKASRPAYSYSAYSNHGTKKG